MLGGGVLVNSCPSEKPNRTTRAAGVRNRVRLTMPFGANCVSWASEMTFSLPASINGCSLMPATYATSPARALMQIK